MDGTLEGKKQPLVEAIFRRHGVKVAYVFGSMARGQAGPLSDVDIGVLLDSRLGKRERFDTRLKMIGEMHVLMLPRSIDLIVLNDVSARLQYEVIKEGRILFCGDEAARVDFEVRAMSAYLDRRFYDRRHAQIVFEQMAQDGLR